MHNPDDIWRPEDEPRFGSARRGRRSPGLAVAIIAVVAIALIGAGASWYWLRSRTSPEPPGASAASPTDPAASTLPEPPPLDLPTLDASDAFIRDLVAGLSSHPELAVWLVNEDLAHRFVAAVVNLADGASPATHVDFLGPAANFGVEESDGRTFVDPASYHRYDLVAETFASLDTQGTAQLYRQLEPLFDQAYRELGFPDGSFNGALTRAIRKLLAVDVPEQPPELVPSPTIATGYEFEDSALEERTPAEKHLIRMGPENARRVQEKLGELLPLISD